MAKQSTQEIVRSPKREAIGVILLAFCLLSVLCVFSFNAEDIGQLHNPPASPPHNLVGPLGAWCAYYLGFLPFGISGYLVPFVLLTGGLMMTLRSYVKVWPVWLWLTIGLISLSSLLEYMPNLWNGPREFLNVGSSGGLIGQMLAIRTLGKLIGHTGAGILFITAFFISILQLTGMHPFTPFIFIWERIKGLRTGRDESREAEPVLEEPVPAQKPAKNKLKKAIQPDDVVEAVETVELFTPPVAVEKPEPKPQPQPQAQPQPQVQPQPKPEIPKPVKPKPVAPPADEMTNVSVNIAPGRDESGYQLPPLSILDKLLPLSERVSTENTEEKSKILQATLEEFGVEGKVTHVETGPTVTSYEITPAAGVRVERISALERNIALALRAQSIRIQAPIPGKGAVGIEVPNTKGTAVYLRELAESQVFHNPEVALPLALGKDVSGRMVVGDLAAMPHLLIAGATGAGKTVCMNSLLTGLLLSRTPDQLRLILVDPKTFEFQAYENLKHLVVPIITDPKKVTLGLRWAIKEMEKRYALFKKVKVRDIKGFNSRPVQKQADLFVAPSVEGEEPVQAPPRELIPAKLPYIVIVVDELAELMSQAQQEIEPCIVRLAQLSRAAGIHMILATQRPSVNVITGTIKANIPGRIAFQVAQGNDSRTILDTIGAEKLLGKGDMLYLPPGKNKPVRLQGTWTSDEEMHRVTNFIRTQGAPEFISEIKQKIENNRPELPDMDESDDLLEAAVEVLRSTKRASTSSLQRRLKIGYNRAARLMDILEEKGIIGPPTETGPRDILIDLDGDIPENVGVDIDADVDVVEAEAEFDVPSEPEFEKPAPPIKKPAKAAAEEEWVTLDDEDDEDDGYV